MRVRGEGPIPAHVAIVGEGPGWEEDREGRPFVGKTGEEVNRFLSSPRLPSRKHIFITNLYREYHGKNYKYTAEDLKRDEPALIEELSRAKPAIIITLGRQSTQWFLGDVSIEAVNGIPYRVQNTGKFSIFEHEIVVFPIVHPAAGFHNPEMSALTVDGFKQLEQFFAGNLEPRVLYDDPVAGKEQYVEITDPMFFETYDAKELAIDTEGWPEFPWSVQGSDHPGAGWMVRGSAPAVLAGFHRYLRRVRPRLIFHHALHDLAVGRALGISEFESLSYDDTMTMAYLLQTEPKGLKALCLRHCNMQMQSYDDIMGDVSDRLAIDYLTGLWDVEQIDYQKRCQAEFERKKQEIWTDKKGKAHHGRRITKVPSLPQTMLHKAVKRCLASKTPRRLWENQVEDVQVAGYHRLGGLQSATLDYIPLSTAIHYGCRDGDGTTRLRPQLRSRLDALQLGSVYDLELSTYPFIERMQRAGLKPDLEHFGKLGPAIDAEIETLGLGLKTSTGREFNANSGNQVSEYLFDELGLEGDKLTESGRYSSDDKTLEALERMYPELPVIADIRKYRKFYKLRHTFIDRIPEFVNRWPYDKRIHCEWRTTTVVTGRLATSNPNLLAQPERGQFAKEFKRGWIAEPGHVLGVWDQSQVELRGLAHLSQDPVLLAVYRGEMRNSDGSLIDLHAKLAQRIFGGKEADYKENSEKRVAAKAINFGLPMGMTAKGLAIELRKNGLNVDQDDAQVWIDETMALYARVPDYMEARIEEAKQNGYVRCLSGRIRYIGGIQSRNGRVRAEAERFAFSTPIQESATLIMKQAEASIYQDILVPYWRQGVYIEPLMQQHDSLKFEMAEGLQGELHQKLSRAMTQVPKTFSVPLTVEGKWGYNLGEMENL